MFDKENYKAANGVRGKVINYDDPHVLEQMDKNLNSPMQIKDQPKIFNYNQSGFEA